MLVDNFEHGYFYHLFNRGNNKEDIFIKPENYTYFLSLMKKYLLPVANVYAYCLLKNHFHLLVQIKEKHEINNEKWKDKPYLGLSHMFNAYAQAFNKAHNRSGSLFRDRPHRIRVANEKYLQQLITYIHLNPIKHRFCSNLSYPYSSYTSMLSDKPTLLMRKEVLTLFDNIENFMHWHNLQTTQAGEILNLAHEG